MARALIAGCGYVGSALAGRLVAQGWAVWGLRRAGPLPGGVESIVADLTDPTTLRGLPGRLDVLIYCVAPGRAAVSADPVGAYRAVYLDGFANLSEALQDDGPPGRTLFVSSTSVYGQTSGEWVDEKSPREPGGAGGRVLVEAEAEVWARGGCVVRFGGIYGPGRTRLIDGIRAGTLSRWTGPPRFTNRTHLDDCAGALAHLATHDGLERAYNAVDHDPAAWNSLIEWLTREVGGDLPGLVEPPRSGRRTTNKRVGNQRLLDTGYEFRYPTFREGYAHLLSVR